MDVRHYHVETDSINQYVVRLIDAVLLDLREDKHGGYVCDLEGILRRNHSVRDVFDSFYQDLTGGDDSVLPLLKNIRSISNSDRRYLESVLLKARKRYAR